jgi:fatty acid desaturase
MTVILERQIPTRSGIFAHSNWDASLVLITLLQLCLIVWGAINFDHLTMIEAAAFAAVQIILAATQYEIVMHNFIHTRFFGSRALNSGFAILCGLPVMNSFTEAAIQHLVHHKHVNDPIDPVTGTTRDPTSTYRFGTAGRHEPLWRYALLAPLRDLAEAPDHRLRPTLRRRIFIERSFLGVFWVAIFAYNWHFLVYYLLIIYTAQVINCAQNYFEHYGAVPGSSLTDSVSCYGRLYNLVWFNNGYHQEHHYRPGVHWSKIKELRREMLPNERRRVVGWAHCMNFPHHRDT